jgi:hypothetical protein
LVDSGTPEESGGLVVANPFEADGRTVGQFLAQAFSLFNPAFISTIEADIGGDAGNAIQMQLTSAIGTAATAADLIGSFSLPTPGLPFAATFVSAPVNMNLQPGTYFLVFSAGLNGGFMPIFFNARNNIGDTFIASNPPFGGTNLNAAFPPASNFSLPAPCPTPPPRGCRDLTGPLGVRIEGNVIPAVPDESSTLVIFNRGYRSARCADMETEFL